MFEPLNTESVVVRPSKEQPILAELCEWETTVLH